MEGPYGWAGDKGGASKSLEGGREGDETPDHFSLAFPGTDPDGRHLLHALV